MIGNLLGCIWVLLICFGILCNLTGDNDKGNQILSNSITAFILYSMIVIIFGLADTSRSILDLRIPFAAGINKYGTMKEYIANSVGMFALDFAQMVTLVLIINWVTNILKFENAGFAGKVSSKIVIVLMAILAYGFVMDLIEDNNILRWCVYCIECLITGGSIIYTPAMIIMTITGIKEGNYVNSYIISQFPKSSLGKAITTAITSSIVFVVFLFMLDMQYGGIYNIMNSTLESFGSIAAVIIILMGIYFIVKSNFTKRKK